MSLRHEAGAHRPSVRVAACGVARGASDILPAVIAHLIGQGIADFYLVLHNEALSVSENLVGAFSTRANLTIIHHDNPTFTPGALSNMLLAQARRDGFDVYLPFDSDEFYVSTDSRFSLTEAIEQWFVHETTEQLHVPNKNFLGPRHLDDFTTRSLGLMTHRLEYKPGVRNNDMKTRLEAMRKSVSRLSGIPDAEFTTVQAGNHSTYRGKNRLTRKPPTPPLNFNIEILHVPFRSRATTENPLLLARAVAATGRNRDDLTQAELAKLFRDMWNDVSLSAEEQAVSLTDKGNYLLYADDALMRILTGIADSGFDVDDPWCASRGTPVPRPEYSSRVIVNEPFFDLAITALSAALRKMDEESSDYYRSRQEARARVSVLQERLSKLRQVNARLRERNRQNNSDS